MASYLYGGEKETSRPELVGDEDIVRVIELNAINRERRRSPAVSVKSWSHSLRQALAGIGVMASLILTACVLITLTTGIPLVSRERPGLHSISAVINPMLVLEPITIELEGIDSADPEPIESAYAASPVDKRPLRRKKAYHRRSGGRETC